MYSDDEHVPNMHTRICKALLFLHNTPREGFGHVAQPTSRAWHLGYLHLDRQPCVGLSEAFALGLPSDGLCRLTGPDSGSHSGPSLTKCPESQPSKSKAVLSALSAWRGKSGVSSNVGRSYERKRGNAPITKAASQPTAAQSRRASSLSTSRKTLELYPSKRPRWNGPVALWMNALASGPAGILTRRNGVARGPKRNRMVT